MTANLWRRMGLYGIAILTVLAYLPALNGDFIWDDRQFIVTNSNLRNLSGLLTIWTNPRAASFPWYPLTLTTFWAEYQLWGPWTFPYHLANVLLHACDAWLLARLLERLEMPGAWFAGLVFAVHPVHVESVAWITERKNVLSTFFFLLSIHQYVAFAGLVKSPAGRPASRAYALSLISFIAALLAKTAVCMLPVALWLLLWMKRPRVGSKDLLSLVPFFFASAMLGRTTIDLEVNYLGASGSSWSLNPLERVLLAGRILWFYAAKLAWPVGLTFFYPRWTVDAGEPTQFLYSAAALLALGVLFALRRRTGREPLVACLFFCAMLLPILGFVNFYFMAYSFVSDHYQYLASMGLIALFCAVVETMTRRATSRRPPPSYTLVAGAVTVVLGAMSSVQARDYRNEETLWRATIHRNPAAWMAETNLGWLLAERGDNENAARHLRAAVRTNPEAALAWIDLGIVEARVGKLDDAVNDYRRALRLDPTNAQAHNLVGVTLAWLGRREAAIEHFRAALRSEPDLAVARANLERTRRDAWSNLIGELRPGEATDPKGP